MRVLFSRSAKEHKGGASRFQLPNDAAVKDDDCANTRRVKKLPIEFMVPWTIDLLKAHEVERGRKNGVQWRPTVRRHHGRPRRKKIRWRQVQMDGQFKFKSAAPQHIMFHVPRDHGALSVATPLLVLCKRTRIHKTIPAKPYLSYIRL